MESSIELPEISKDKDYIFYKVRSEDMGKLLAYEKFILKHLRKRDKLPARVFKRYCSFFIEDSEEKVKLLQRFQQEKIDGITAFFKQDKEYYFSKTKIVKSKRTSVLKLKLPDTKVFVYDFSQMIDYVADELIEILLKDKTYRTNKTKFLYETMRLLQDYLDKHLPKSKRKWFTAYKERVVVGYIAMMFGHKLANITPTTKYQIQHAIKHTFDKVKAAN